MTEHGGPQQPDPTQPYQGQPDPAQPYQPGPPYGAPPPAPGQPVPGQPMSGQPWGQPPGPPAPGQPWGPPADPAQPWGPPADPAQPWGPPAGQGDPGQAWGQPPGPPAPGQPWGQPGPGQPMPLGQPFPPPAKKKAPVKALVIGGVTVVVLIAGCCIGGSFLIRDKDDPVAGGGSDDKPVSAAEYATVLSEVDAALQAPFAALAKDDKAAFATAAQGLRDGSNKLSATEAPAVAGLAQSELTSSMNQLADVVEEAGTAKAACPAGSPAAAVLTSDEAGLVRDDAKAMAAADPVLAFGTFLPAAPKEQTRQLKSGTFIKKGPGGGRGVLKITNSADGDTTVTMTGKGAKKAVFTVFVRGGDDYTVKNIKPGTYEIYTASGEDWDAGKEGFTRKCGFNKFDDKFDYDSSGNGWEITLKQSFGGNASTSDVDPGNFPTD